MHIFWDRPQHVKADLATKMQSTRPTYVCKENKAHILEGGCQKIGIKLSALL